MRNLVQQSWSNNKAPPGVDTVTCASCGQENREGRKFCSGCGTALAVACSACGTANEPGESFCGECGASLQHVRKPNVEIRTPEPAAWTPKHLADKILHAKSALEGERKRVTVLFADVKLDGPRRAARSRGLAPHHGPLLPPPGRRRAASREPSPSTPATASWRSSGPRSRTRITPSAPAGRRQNRELPQAAGVAERYDRVRFSLRFLITSLRWRLRSFNLAICRCPPDSE